MDTKRLLTLLESATGPLTYRQIVIETVGCKGFSPKRIQLLCSRMWCCLEYQRKLGVVAKVAMPQSGKKCMDA